MWFFFEMILYSVLSSFSSGCGGGVLQQTSFERGLMIVGELGGRFRVYVWHERLLAVTWLSVEQPSCMIFVLVFNSFFFFLLLFLPLMLFPREPNVLPWYNDSLSVF